MTRRWRPSGSLVVSIAVHVVLGAALLWVMSLPIPVMHWFHLQRTAPAPEQHVTYAVLPPAAPPRAARSGGDNRPVRPHERPAPPLTAPTRVPTTLPPATPAAKSPPRGGSGPVVGKGGIGEGVTPSYNDPRVWLPPGPILATPKPETERLDSALVAILGAHNDSLRALAGAAPRAPGDWTIDKNGKKYGIDSRKIYLGGFSIPTAILALIPFKGIGNPTEVASERALNFQRGEILNQAQRAMNEEDFRTAVKQIRERKQREHDAEMKARAEQKKKQQQQHPESDNPIAQPN